MTTKTIKVTPDRIRDARLRACLTQDDLARALGISARTLYNWERGLTVPRGANLVLIRSWLTGLPAAVPANRP